MLWSAPELLHNPNIKEIRARQKSDIYSFAIIGHESRQDQNQIYELIFCSVLFEQGPYWTGPYNSKKNSQMIEQLVDKIKYNIRDVRGRNTRPHLPSDNDEWCKLCNIPNNDLKSDAYSDSINVLELLITCWDQSPKKRPAFDEILSFNRKQADIIEDLQIRLQEYTDRLG